MGSQYLIAALIFTISVLLGMLWSEHQRYLGCKEMYEALYDEALHFIREGRDE